MRNLYFYLFFFFYFSLCLDGKYLFFVLLFLVFIYFSFSNFGLRIPHGYICCIFLMLIWSIGDVPWFQNHEWFYYWWRIIFPFDAGMLREKQSLYSCIWRARTENPFKILWNRIFREFRFLSRNIWAFSIFIYFVETKNWKEFHYN